MNHHQWFVGSRRSKQSLGNVRCQTILYKAVFEHFVKIPNIAALLHTSKSFQDSSFGANFVVNFKIGNDSISLVKCILSPSSCLSLQFVPSLHIQHIHSFNLQKIDSSICEFVSELFSTKYFPLHLGALALDDVVLGVVESFFHQNSVSYPQLQSLSLCQSDLSENGIACISKAAPHLTTLDLAAAAGVTDNCLEHISTLSALKSLNLTSCGRISDAGLLHVAKLSGITNLDVVFCDLITDAGLEHLSNCHNIVKLNLAYCKRVTSAGLGHLSRLSNMINLNLYRCDRITDEGLELLSNLSELAKLNIGWCDNISAQCKADFRNRVPDCWIEDRK